MTRRFASIEYPDGKEPHMGKKSMRTIMPRKILLISMRRRTGNLWEIQDIYENTSCVSGSLRNGLTRIPGRFASGHLVLSGYFQARCFSSLLPADLLNKSALGEIPDHTSLKKKILKRVKRMFFSDPEYLATERIFRLWRSPLSSHTQKDDFTGTKVVRGTR